MTSALTNLHLYKKLVIGLIVSLIAVNLMRPLIPKLHLKFKEFARQTNLTLKIHNNEVPVVQTVYAGRIFQHDAPLGVIQITNQVISLNKTAAGPGVEANKGSGASNSVGPMGYSERHRLEEELNRKVMDVTIVTAYFNLGKFQKGGPGNVYTPQRYLNWMRVFSKIKNPVIAYLDSEDSVKYMQQLRNGKPGKVILVKRTDMWSYRLRDQIDKVYKQPGYPKHPPNTVVPEYSCAMHAKFEALNESINHNYYNSSYFSWIDIGLFRDISNTELKRNDVDFGLVVPTNFDSTSVSYSIVGGLNNNLTWRDIVFGNQVFVGGAGNLATKAVMTRFIEQYKQTVNAFLDNNLMSTDQQIIYGMYNKDGTKHGLNKVPLQIYESGWFKIGYLMRETWHKAHTEILKNPQPTTHLSAKLKPTTTKPKPITTKPNSTTVKHKPTTVKPNPTTVKPNPTTIKHNSTTAKHNQTTTKPNLITFKLNSTTVRTS